MNRTPRGRTLGGMLGGLAVLGLAATWRRRQHTRHTHRYMPGEVLLTFVDTTSKPAPDDARVLALLRRAARTAGVELEPVGEQRSGRPHEQDRGNHVAGSPLTVRLRARPSHLPGRRDAVKRAADRINACLDSLQHQGIAVSSAAPNWIISNAAGWGGGHDGPGTLPAPAPAGAWSLDVPAPGSWPDGTPTPSERIVVAILDASPGLAAVQAAAARPQFAGNALLQHLAHDGVIVDWSRFSPPDDVPSHRSDGQADHGLFVAGIINRIAPHAEIHLLHVLDDRGVGRTDLLLDALDYCLALARAGRPVVVNLSLYLTIPPGEELWDHWFGPYSRHAMTRPSRRAALIEALDESVEQRIDLLLDAGAVVVAAAGNDALVRRRRGRGGPAPEPVADGAHPQPRLPADYDGVFCVVAADRSGKIASYSNRADVPPTGNCVATYGGQGMLDGDGRIAVIPPGSDPRDGVVSVYTRPAVPTGDGPGLPNTTGWAYWSGTSFATPIISGIAANLLAKNALERQANPAVPRLTPRDVMTKVLDMAAPPATTDPALGCPYIPVTQQA